MLYESQKQVPISLKNENFSFLLFFFDKKATKA